MPERRQRLSALAALSAAGSYGANPAAPGLVLIARRGLTLVDLRGNPQSAKFLESAAASLGAPLPLAPNTSVSVGDGTVIGLGPDEWLLVGDHFSESLPIAGGFLTDVSHGRAAMRVSGPRAREVLAKGCSLDLHPSQWPAGQCAQTPIARVSVLLHFAGEGSVFDLYCARSYAGHLWQWLAEAAGEFGYQVA